MKRSLQPVCPVTRQCLQGTIRDNIAYGCEDATDEQVFEAANAANAMAFIKKAPAGMRTPVSPLLSSAFP